MARQKTTITFFHFWPFEADLLFFIQLNIDFPLKDFLPRNFSRHGKFLYYLILSIARTLVNSQTVENLVKI
ncbi:MAG: hypothetical protein COU42_00940 [Candidatus Nealsonbacteria bacterium CG10_big_fil_rev_8_21_14_0_10_36_24]|uniref:Uncharacterized protein n=1 Tax=Candidatus Nealsonbacteria bacterium CG10_big_fil_rev_8_21_14_0_10_36_24 TaxID=1974710 RepID=A0A2M6NSE3_9BACT|nr:MAG: hypothetical protein COU42_00940 [Candidatus Nealsonbacteria bacterium CG10_big_fil_rev_8_21_14_0_10_36_24]